MTAVLLDVDGTLVDTNYQHALAWYRAFREHELVLPLWRIHRHIGMGGDQFVQALTDESVERERGDAIRASEGRLYRQMIDEVRPMDGARELLEELSENGHSIVLASSAKEEELEHYIDLLGARDLADGWTSSADVKATKPHPDIVRAALGVARAQPADAVMVGDSTWDCRAAAPAGVDTIAVLTGGFSREELTEAGAVAVFESVSELRDSLSGTRLG